MIPYDEKLEIACEEAAYYIGHNLKKYGRVRVSQWKSKYGTVRVYCSFGFFELFHGIFYPGYAYLQFPKWFIPIDYWLGEHISPYINKLIVPYQKWLYRYLYRKANDKWPELGDRLLEHADWDELLVGIPNKAESKTIDDYP